MRYFVIDLESDGLKCGYNQITECSILNCQTIEQITWLIRIKDPKRCSKQALYITKKTAEELMSRGRYIEDVLDEISEFILRDVASSDEIVMIAHNASFDRRFIEDAFLSNNKKFPGVYWLCSKEMSSKYTRNVLGIQKTSHALSEMLITAKIKSAETDIHTSCVDVRNTFRLWKKMVSDGMSNSLFIKMSPAYLAEEDKPTQLKKKGKKSKAEEFSLEDIMEEQIDQPFEEENDDD
jgi:DNA polymerase III alpha subunit (gram-positive type)